jgi:hypothetical protein
MLCGAFALQSNISHATWMALFFHLLTWRELAFTLEFALAIPEV